MLASAQLLLLGCFAHLFWADKELPALPVTLHDAGASATATHGRAHILCLTPTLMLALAACLCLLLLLPCRNKQQHVSCWISYPGIKHELLPLLLRSLSIMQSSKGSWAGTLIWPFPCNKA
jgi:hypothetical protein